MDGMIGLLVAGTAGSVVYLLLWTSARARAQAWQAAARAAGLSNVQTTSLFGLDTRMTGETGPLRVRLEWYHRGRHEWGTRVVIGGLRHASQAVVIRPEGVGSRIEKAFGEREVELGDDLFDGVAYLQGGPALIRALFDARTRDLMRELLGGHLHVRSATGLESLNLRTSVSNSELRVEIREAAFGGIARQRLPETLPILLDLARQLTRPDDVAGQIAANTAREPLPAVRLANLLTLAREFPAHPATRQALVAALGDGSQEVRLRAAITLGQDGREVLLEMATGDEVADQHAARAIAALGDFFPARLATETLQRALGAARPEVARACIQVIGRTGEPDRVDVLGRVLATAGDELAEAAATALGGAAGEAAERALIEALGHLSAGVRIAAAGALGRLASPLAVVPLRDCAGEHPFDGALRRATREAIAQIQRRVTGGSPGQLSLTAGEIGQVSLVDGDLHGRVSLEPDGQTDP